MNEIITIQDRGGIHTVNARELWEKLESKRQFGNWIEDRLKDFTVDSDFTVNKFVNGKATQIDYHLTIETAKHIAMLERNDKGREIRQYFIDVENSARKAFSIPQTFSDALQLAADQARKIQEQTKTLEAQRPKVEFFDDLATADEGIPIGELAKILNIQWIGQNKLFAILRQKKVLMDLVPFQEYIDRRWFKVVLTGSFMKHGKKQIAKRTFVLQKGIDGIRKLIKVDNNELSFKQKDIFRTF